MTNNKLVITRCDQEVLSRLNLNAQSLKSFQADIEARAFLNKLSSLTDDVYLFENDEESATYHLNTFNDKSGIRLLESFPKTLNSPFKVFLNVSWDNANKYLQGIEIQCTPKILLEENGVEVVEFTNTDTEVIPKENQNILGRDEFSRLIHERKNTNNPKNYIVVNEELMEF